jgi:hypothetical protein
MFVVMVVLLMVTSLATFSVHATGYELRAAGFQRQGMQARFIAEGALDATFALLDNPRFGPAGLDHVIQETRTNATFNAPQMEPFEPEVLPNRASYRFYSDDFLAFGGMSPAPRAALSPAGGMRQPYEPTFEVDVTDYYEFTGTIAGEPAGGASTLRYVYATYTARARLRLPDNDADGTRDDFAGAAGIDPRRDYHEVAHAARAYGVSGPF